MALAAVSSHTVALRIDGCFDDVIKWADKWHLGGFAVRETVAGENQHWHFVLEGPKSLKQLRSSFNREVPGLTGNGAYSLTQVKDIEKYLRYLCKGGGEGQLPEISWTNSLIYTSDKISELHDAYWSENKKLKKRKAGSMIDWIVDEAKRRAIQYHARDKLAEMYIRELAERGKPINLYSIKSNLNTAQFLLCPDDSILRSLTDHVLAD